LTLECAVCWALAIWDLAFGAGKIAAWAVNVAGLLSVYWGARFGVRCHAIDGYGLAWIEEPMVYDDLDGHAQLAAELKTPVQIGENFYGPRELHKALQKKACDLVMPDFMRIGGVTGWMRAAAIAGAAGVPISTHLYPEVAAHVMRATEAAHWLEWQDWADPILRTPYRVEDGLLHIPDAPGVGLEWNEEAVAAHEVKM
jgi:mandelate racemase